MSETERILSQNEVDALLSAIDSAVPEMGADAAAALPYDFRKPSRPSAEQLRGLEQLHESFAKRASEALTALLRIPCDVRLAGAHAVTVREALLAMPNPTALAALGVAPGDGAAVLQIGPAVALPVVERLLGSPRVGPPGEPRALTAVEWTVLDAALGRLLELLGETWTALSPARFSLGRRESDPGALPWARPEEPAVTAVLELVVGDQRGSLELVYPTASFETALAALKRSAPASPRPPEPSLSERLSGAELGLTAELPPSRLRLGDARTLKAGDVIVTAHPATGPVELRVEGRTVYAGTLGRRGERKALRIAGPSAGEEGPSREASIRRGGGEGEELPATGELPLEAAAVLAEKDVALGEALAMRPGDLLGFPKRADGPIELRAGGRAVARGAAVLLGERFGLRLSGGA